MLIHVYCTNRGILLSPVHDMALVSPVTTEEEVARYVRVIGECVQELLA
jgi:glutamate-1-semialdehyde 2,1-aminomutase